MNRAKSIKELKDMVMSKEGVRVYLSLNLHFYKRVYEDKLTRNFIYTSTVKIGVADIVSIEEINQQLILERTGRSFKFTEEQKKNLLVVLTKTNNWCYFIKLE